MNIVLASSSPRRRELLTNAGISHLIAPTNADEHVPHGTSAHDTVEMLSRRKADGCIPPDAEDIIIAADTVVLLGDEILNKPRDAADAKRMLTEMSGSRHTVYTGVTLKQGDKRISFVRTTDVYFYPLTEAEIDAYIATGEPMDKAGAYGIQQRGVSLVERIDGDYFNVIGLPVASVIRCLRRDFNADI